MNFQNASLIRVGFGLLVLFLVAQFVIATKVVQPYPALVLPSFGHVPKGTLGTSISNFDIVAHQVSGRQTTLQPWELAPDVIPRHARFTVGKLKSLTTTGFKKKVSLGGQTFNLRLGKRSRMTDYGEFSENVLRRLTAQLGADDPVDRVVVTYYTARFAYADLQFSDRKETASFIIEKPADELVK